MSLKRKIQKAAELSNMNVKSFSDGVMAGAELNSKFISDVKKLHNGNATLVITTIMSSLTSVLTEAISMGFFDGETARRLVIEGLTRTIPDNQEIAKSQLEKSADEVSKVLKEINQESEMN